MYNNNRQLPQNTNLKDYSKDLRRAGNLSEVLLWQQIKNKQMQNYSFYRQKIVGNYIVDFYCPKLKLVIEIDGESHNEKSDYDEKREKYLESLGLKVIHFLDGDIKINLEAVMDFLNDYIIKITFPALASSGTPLS